MSTIDTAQIWPTLQQLRPLALSINKSNYEDTLQEAALYVLSNIHKCKSSFKGFCYWAVINAANKFEEQESKFSSFLDITPQDANYRDHYALKTIHRFLPTISPTDQVIIKALLNNESDEEIASKLSLSHLSFLKAKHRAIKDLRQRIRANAAN